MQKVVLAVVAFHLTPRQVIAVRNLFESIDLDRSGTISFEELANAVKSVPISSLSVTHEHSMPKYLIDDQKLVDDATIIEIFKAVDISRTTEINFTEFLEAFYSILIFFISV